LTRILALGDTGMVGRAVARRLRESGGEFTRANRTGADGGLVFDARTPASLDELLREADLVVNAVGVLRPDAAASDDDYRLTATRVNAEFPLVLAAAAARYGCRVINISSNAVFGTGDIAADEATVPAPSDSYGFTKALGEAQAPHVINIRCSVIGPAPARRSGLWEWFVGHAHRSRVVGYTGHLWTGVTSRQLAVMCTDLADACVFERVRSTGAAQHFVPNEPITKFDLLCLLRDALRPDMTVVPEPAPAPPVRPIVSARGLLTGLYSGERGWTATLVAAAVEL
jgi:dTDP-4-dehydrorhamnose reductase